MKVGSRQPIRWWILPDKRFSLLEFSAILKAMKKAMKFGVVLTSYRATN